jgi:hypothetical protein
MKYLLLVSAAAMLAACGKDVTAPDASIQCETEKRAELVALFGVNYTPTDPLLRQSQWTFGSSVVVWHADCSFTKTP